MPPDFFIARSSVACFGVFSTTVLVNYFIKILILFVYVFLIIY